MNLLTEFPLNIQIKISYLSLVYTLVVKHYIKMRKPFINKESFQLKTLFLILFIFGQTLSAQTEELIANLCSGKWHGSYRAYEGQRKLYSMPVSSGYWTIFYPDGSTLISNGWDDYYGEWKLNPKTMTLITKDRKGIIHKRIIRLTKSDFAYVIRNQLWDTEYGFKKME